MQHRVHTFRGGWLWATLALALALGVVAVSATTRRAGWWGVIVGSAVAVSILGAAALAHRSRAQRQRAVAADVPEGATAFPIRYASHERFHAWKKVMPWEASGLLVIWPDHAELWLAGGDTVAKTPLTPESATVEWTGQHRVNGSLSWIKLTMRDDVAYLTADHGPFAGGSKGATHDIFDALAACLSRPVSSARRA